MLLGGVEEFSSVDGCEGGADLEIDRTACIGDVACILGYVLARGRWGRYSDEEYNHVRGKGKF